MQIFCFGDSITYGKSHSWVEKLREQMEKKTDRQGKENIVFNLGVPGDSSRDLLNRFESETKVRASENANKKFFFQFGINDVMRLKEKNDNRVSIEEFGQNLEKLYIKARKFTEDENIYFLGFTPIIESKTDPLDEDNNKRILFNEVREYEDKLYEFCGRKQVNFIEMFDLFMENGYSDLLLDDGFHPGPRGHKKIFEKVRDNLISENPPPISSKDNLEKT